MIQPWSITTTTRNPERIKAFLSSLKEMEGDFWDKTGQMKFQILLIKNRLYGYGNTQFYKNLSRQDIELINNSKVTFNYERAKEIFIKKNYKDSPMRGRQSINLLLKFGLARIIGSKVTITKFGNSFLNNEFDLGEMLFRVLLKWQLPNPLSNDYKASQGFNIKPFIGTLHLINKVNQKSVAESMKAKGLSRTEFNLFVPTLININNIEEYSNLIISLRNDLKGKDKHTQKEIFTSYKKNFISKFLGSTDEKYIKKLDKNLKDYGDNVLRCFRLTRYLHLRGNGYFIDLEPRRSIEINKLLDYDDGAAIALTNGDTYSSYLSDINQPILPWESIVELIQISTNLIEEIRNYESTLLINKKIFPKYQFFEKEELINFVNELRMYRKELQRKENAKESQEQHNLEDYIYKLKNIYTLEDKPLNLEKFTAFGYYALNDAISIKPNYPVGDDNEPTFTAPANKPDIECLYKNHNTIVEVTMLTSRSQWFNEGQPVMRHLRDFEENNQNNNTYCIFIAPNIHRDTLNTFWSSIKLGYEGVPQKIIPLTIDEFITILETQLHKKRNNEKLLHTDLFDLYERILQNSLNFQSSTDWIRTIPEIINQWSIKFKHIT